MNVPVPPTAPPAASAADPPTWLLVAAVAAGGAAGAVCRFGVGAFAAAKIPSHPWLGTLAVNLAGCFLIGFASYAAVGRGILGPTGRAAAVTGFLGGLTTFSTFGQEAVTLGRGEDGLPLAALHVALNVGGGLLLVWCGRRLAGAVFGG